MAITAEKLVYESLLDEGAYVSAVGEVLSDIVKLRRGMAREPQRREELMGNLNDLYKIFDEVVGVAQEYARRNQRFDESVLFEVIKEYIDDHRTLEGLTR